MSHPSLLSYIRRVLESALAKRKHPFYLVLAGKSRGRIVCHSSAGPTRTIWEEPYGTAANADTFGQALCALPASIVITNDARVAPPIVQESLRILLPDAPKGHLVQFCPHNTQSHITL
jgi:hypothetical protein